jgi:hypothetical protein
MTLMMTTSDELWTAELTFCEGKCVFFIYDFTDLFRLIWVPSTLHREMETFAFYTYGESHKNEFHVWVTLSLSCLQFASFRLPFFSSAHFLLLYNFEMCKICKKRICHTTANTAKFKKRSEVDVICALNKESVGKGRNLSPTFKLGTVR